MKINRTRLILGFSLIFLLGCALMMSGILARYKTVSVIANEVDYTNQLAEAFKLLDKPVIVGEDGSYSVDESAGAQPTDGFRYHLIPGITIPAAPYVEITGKTQIPAYLYLEVDNTGGASLSFDNSWTELDVAGKKGGKVYVYDNGAALTGDDTEAILTVPTFTVDTLSKYPDDLSEGEVKVYAYMLQKEENTNAGDTYSAAPTP